MSRTRRQVTGAVVVVVGVAVAVAAMTATEAIRQRQKAMEGVGDGMKTVVAMVKGEAPFDAEAVHAAGASISSHLSEAAGLFPAGSDQGEVQTWAKPEIWSDRAHFDELLDSAREAALGLQSVTDAKALPAALGTLGTACKDCHSQYRLPKQ